jgi:hypothetical protein
VSPRRNCQRCGLRWVQARGLCRTCERQTGADTRTTFERELDAYMRRQTQGLHVARVAPRPARVNPIVVVDGVTFEVMWDGT